MGTDFSAEERDAPPGTESCTIPFPFLRLPAELRNQFYEYTASDIVDQLYSRRDDRTRLYRDSRRFLRRCHSGHFGLTLVSRQIRAEVLPLFQPPIPYKPHVVTKFRDLTVFLDTFFPSFRPTKASITKMSVEITLGDVAVLREYDMLPLIRAKAVRRSVEWDFKPDISFFSEPRKVCDLLDAAVESLEHSFMNDVQSELFSGFRFQRWESGGCTTQKPPLEIWETDWKFVVVGEDDMFSHCTTKEPPLKT
jgi:hypothetical protein